ncbi:MAG: hypothetical protein AABW56_03985 [Nanoarchaeota archaeon]
MDKLSVCSFCKTNLSSYSCKFCGRGVCINCSKNGICKECVKRF